MFTSTQFVRHLRLSVLISVLIYTHARAGNIIQNGSFELGVPGYPGGAADWQGGTVRVKDGSYNYYNGVNGPTDVIRTLAPTDGHYTLAIFRQGVVTQDVHLNLGSTYTLSFDLSAWQPGTGIFSDPNGYYGNSTNFLAQIQTDYQSAWHYYDVTSLGGGWQRETITLTPTQAYSRAIIWFVGGGVVDNISLTESAGQNSVPDSSSTCALMAFSLLGLVALRRRFARA
jgi:VPDSG-CTERM motif